MPSFVANTRHDEVLVIEINNPPVNALSPGVPEALIAAIDAAESDPAAAAIVIKGAGRTFVAGADITKLEQAAWGERDAVDLHEVLQRVEDCRKPVVMAIHGSALGGGLELAMAGHFRVAAADAQLGQPEVNLGIIPGGEGTQRLPRLVGLEKALEMCIAGQPMSAAAGRVAGLIDEIAEDDLMTSAIALAKRVAGGSWRRTRERADRLGSAEMNAPLYDAARRLAERVRPRETAPLRAIAAIDAAATLPFPAGCARERELFLESLRDEQAKALIHVFFAERQLRKRPEAGGHASALADRLLRRFRDEARFLLEDGATPEQVARVLASFGVQPKIAAADEPLKHHERGLPDDEILDRLVYALVNEGAHAMANGAEMRASDVDVIAVRAGLCPAWRGGPMFYADRVGLSSVLARVAAFHDRDGERWQPAPLLVELAESRRTFRDRDRS
jgi:enoyl-CoA hydratase/carnithine racemase